MNTETELTHLSQLSGRHLHFHHDDFGRVWAKDESGELLGGATNPEQALLAASEELHESGELRRQSIGDSLADDIERVFEQCLR